MTAQSEVYRELAGAFSALNLPLDMAERFVSAGYFPIPKQLLFHAAARECDKRDGPTDVGLGGARGGAKSHGVLAQLALDDCQRQPGLKTLWLRQIGVAARESLEDLVPRVVKIPYGYVSSPVPTIRFGNGSRIIVGHFNNEKDISRYLGLEYDVIATEEATQLTTSKDQQIGSCLRTSKPNWRPRRYYSTNPGGVGHAWFKQRFIDPARKNCQTVTRFIFSTFRDNPFLNSEYVNQLDRLTGWLRAAWRDGDWDIAAGQFFSTWRHDAIVRANLRIMPGAPVWCSLDYGFQHPTVCYLFSEYDGKKQVIDEHWRRHALAAEHAIDIKNMLARHGLVIDDLCRFVAGSDAFAQRGSETGKTIADQYDDAGIHLVRANDDRINGAAYFLKLLGRPGEKDEPAIEPILEISTRCVKLIENIPSLQHDPHRPEDVLKVNLDDDGNGGDDPYDAARYGLMARMVARDEESYSTGYREY